MRFSLIIPSYNNSDELIKELPLLLNYFSSQNLRAEVIIVDDGSKEKSQLSAFCRSMDIVLISHSKNIGKGAAVSTGMLAAKQDICIFTDADIPFHYGIFSEILEKFDHENDLKVVCGTRENSSYFSKTSFTRRLGSKVFSSLVSIIVGKRLGDTQCGIKAFKSDVIPTLFANNILTGFATDIEWLYLANRNKFKADEVVAEFRNSGSSSIVFWKHAFVMLKDVMKMRWHYIGNRKK